MFKKLITLMLALSIFTVQANASTSQGLKAAFDELNYSLTTEWDQKDKAFYESEMKKFAATVRDLQSKGLTNAQLIEFAKVQMKDAKAAKDFETAMSMIHINQMSSADASKYVLETMKKSYSAGASWSGDAVLITVVVVALAVVIAVAISNGGGSSSGGGGGGGGSCYYENVYVCDSYCYYDDWYGYTCYDDCYYVNEYVCY